MLFAWLRSRRAGAIQLEDESSDTPVKPQPEELRGWKMLLLWLPAACDLTGTTVSYLLCLSTATCANIVLQLMNVGLLYTPVSIYQMTRGALVLFVGVLSVIFLRRRLWLYQLVLFVYPPSVTN